MLRALVFTVDVIFSAIVVLVATPLIFLLGGELAHERGEMVVDPELDSDDPGVDVDD